MATLSIQECMDRHKVSRDSITIMFKKKGSPAYKIGAQWRVEEDEWLEYLKKEAEKSKG